jgi:2,3-bisphosphoglycerate-independent phosphoglycerate mutase
MSAGPDAARLALLRRLAVAADTRLLLVVIDGLGGLPTSGGGLTELEAARTPHLDALADAGTLGLLTMVAPGIIPGSGPGHLALLGFDPLEVRAARGVLEALGSGLRLEPGDVAVRGNLCLVDAGGRVVDRRAGRLGDERARQLLERLADAAAPGVAMTVRHVAEHRFVLVLRGEELGAEVADTDPGRVGVEPPAPRALRPTARVTAEALGNVVAHARRRLAGEPDANMIILRGAGHRPQVPTLREAYGLRALAVARYPMYRGVARLVGMDVATLGGPGGEPESVRRGWERHDFAFVHFKGADRAGEDGDPQAKIAAIEAVDAQLEALLDPRPDVVVVTGDHCTPSSIGTHSWHPVPVLLASRRCRPDEQTAFGERQCTLGGLGHFEAKHLLALMLAHGGRLAKFDG